jgi:hypothetical protein
VRGGEWVKHDRAKLETPLGIWRRAESGDAEPTVVGEIYEGRHGVTMPRLVSQAPTRATRVHQFNLGTLYEQGLGVEKDAAGAQPLSLMAVSRRRRLQACRRELEQQRATRRSRARPRIDALGSRSRSASASSRRRAALRRS